MQILKCKKNQPMRLKHSLLAGAFLVLVILGAKVDIKLAAPVLFTLQTLFLGVAYSFLSFSWRIVLILCYLILGAAGVPVFSGGEGWVYFLSWPFGFFVGFALGALLPWHSKGNGMLLFYNFALFHGVVVCCGVFWVIFFSGSSVVALDMGLQVLPGAVLKSILGAYFVWFARQVRWGKTEA